MNRLITRAAHGVGMGLATRVSCPSATFVLRWTSRWDVQVGRSGMAVFPCCSIASPCKRGSATAMNHHRHTPFSGSQQRRGQAVESAPQEQIVGRWCYRSPLTGFVIGDFEVCRSQEGQLQIVEENSRGGRLLSGDLRAVEDGWSVAELQGGNFCRLKLISEDSVVSQFREDGKDWEPEVTSQRIREHDGTLGGWLHSRGFVCPESLAHLRLAVLVPCVSFTMSGLALASFHDVTFAAGLMVLMFVHELGHAAMMWRLGVQCGPMVFVPLVGAAVEMKGKPKAMREEVLIALAGPLLGSFAALCCFASGLAVGSHEQLRLAYWGFLFNLLNLLPLKFLDGGKVVAPLPHQLKLAGLALSGFNFMAQQSSIVSLCFFLASCHATRPWQPHLGPSELPARQAMLLGIGYFAFVGMLFGCCHVCMDAVLSTQARLTERSRYSSN